MDIERQKYVLKGAEAEEVLAEQGDHVLCLAPHAGDIEPNTGKQAMQVAKGCRVPTVGSTAWVFRGFNNGSTRDTWHIPSNEIKPNGRFELLDHIWDKQFYRGVAFHGWDQDGILVGGHGSDFIAKAVSDRLPSKASVKTADETREHTGDQDSDLVNRLAEKPVRITQSRLVRKHHWQDVAGALITVFTESH